MSKAETVPPDAARLRVTLCDLDPAPWREIEVPLSLTLKGLHDAIQAAFLWHDAHLWEFEIARERYTIPFDDDFGFSRTHDAKKAKLTMLRERKIRKFSYIYDMGDFWEHQIQVVELFKMPADVRLPALVGGEWRTPPEDSGGAPGFIYFLEVLADSSHEEHDDLVEWYGHSTFESKDFEPDAVKKRMARLAARTKRA